MAYNIGYVYQDIFAMVLWIFKTSINNRLAKEKEKRYFQKLL